MVGAPGLDRQAQGVLREWFNHPKFGRLNSPTGTFAVGRVGPCEAIEEGKFVAG